MIYLGDWGKKVSEWVGVWAKVSISKVRPDLERIVSNREEDQIYPIGRRQSIAKKREQRKKMESKEKRYWFHELIS